MSTLPWSLEPAPFDTRLLVQMSDGTYRFAKRVMHCGDYTQYSVWINECGKFIGREVARWADPVSLDATL